MEVNVNLHLSVKPCEPQQQTFAFYFYSQVFVSFSVSLSIFYTLPPVGLGFLFQSLSSKSQALYKDCNIQYNY